jgi:hypothetical protein
MIKEYFHDIYKTENQFSKYFRLTITGFTVPMYLSKSSSKTESLLVERKLTRWFRHKNPSNFVFNLDLRSVHFALSWFGGDKRCATTLKFNEIRLFVGK